MSDPTAEPDCLDDDAVLRLVERAMEPAEREAAEAHMDRCAICRELVSATARDRGSASGAPEDGEVTRGALIGRYRIEKPLGVGGMGVVYLAHDPMLGRPVAIKLLGDRRVLEPDSLVRESRALASLNHPNVVTVHEVGEHQGRVFLVMEHVAGGTLVDWLAAAARDADQVLAVFVQGARGLAAAHAAGLVHRDFKPDNLLIGDDGRVRVSDFGLARTGGELGGADPASRTLSGTPRYMAPEVIRGEPASPTSDQWSFAMACWESLFSDPPRGASRRVERVLRRALDPSPARRWPSMDDLAEALAPRRRLVRAAVLLVLSTAVASSLVARVAFRPEPPDRCGGVAGETTSLWGSPQRRAVSQAIAATRDPEAGAVARAVAGGLDDWSRRWSQRRAAACRAEHAGSATPATATCLEQARDQAAALIAELAAIRPASLQSAVLAVHSLPDPAACDRSGIQALAQPIPAEPAAAARVAALSRELDTAWARLELGRTDTIDRAREVAAEGERLGFHPLAARAWLLVARIEMGRDAPRAFEPARRAVLAAERGGGPVQTAEAWCQLIDATVFASKTPAELAELAEHAEAAAARIGWLDPTRDALYRGKLHASLATASRMTDPARARQRMTEAVALLDRAGPAGRLDAAMARQMLASHLVSDGDAVGALRLVEQAVPVITEMAGERSIKTVGMRFRLARALSQVGRSDEALEQIRRALGQAQRIDDFAALRGPLVFLEASIRRERGELDRARQILQAGLADPALNPPIRAAMLGLLASVDLDARDLPAAGRGFDAALAELGRLGRGESTDAESARLGKAAVLVESGQPRRARPRLERSLAWLEEHGGSSEDIAYARFLLARALWDGGGDRSRARRLAEEARRTWAGLSSSSGAGDAARVEAWLRERAQ